MTNAVREWRVLEIEDEEQPGIPYYLAVDIERIERQDASSAGGEITLRLYHINGGPDAPGMGKHYGLVGIFGGRYVATTDTGYEYAVIGGGMQLTQSLRGLHIGTYVQNEVIRWAKAQRHPGRVACISLSASDASNEDERNRRNRFYEQFGITFEWDPPVGGIEYAEGRSTPTLTIDVLHDMDFVEGVRVMAPESVLRRFAGRMQRAEAERDRHVEARASAKRHYENEAHHAERRAKSAYVLAGLAGAATIVLSIILGRVIGV